MAPGHTGDDAVMARGGTRLVRLVPVSTRKGGGGGAGHTGDDAVLVKLRVPGRGRRARRRRVKGLGRGGKGRLCGA
jgi:hypothetical protein